MALQRVETDAIQDDAITTAKIAPNAVAAADIAADAITNVKVAAGAAIAVAKISGLGTAATLTAGTAANNVVQLDGSGRLPAVSGANLTGVSTDTSAMENNIAILAFKTQSANNLAKFNLIDQVVDEYKDATGVAVTDVTQAGANATDGYLATMDSGQFTSDSYTSLLVHSDTTNGSTTFTDSSSYGHTITRIGSMVHSTTQNKIGSTSWAFTGATAFYVPWHASLQFDADFTIEFWVYCPNPLVGQDRLINHHPHHHYNNGGQWDIETASDPTDAFRMEFGSSGHHSTTGEKYNTAAWNYVVMQRRSANNIDVYINGTREISETCLTGTTGDRGNIAIGAHVDSSNAGSEFAANGYYMDELRISKGIARYSGTSMTPPAGSTNATGNVISTANTALSAPTTGDICMLVENFAGTATLNTDLKAFVSRNGGTGWDQATLVDKGSWGTNKKILTANNVAFSNSASGTDMRYKIEWANQASGSKETRVHATSLAWA